MSLPSAAPLAPLAPLSLPSTTTTETETETSSTTQTPSPTTTSPPPPPPPLPPLLRSTQNRAHIAAGHTLCRPCKTPIKSVSTNTSLSSLPTNNQTELHSSLTQPYQQQQLYNHHNHHYNSTTHYCHDCLSSPSPPPSVTATTITEQAVVHASSSLSSLLTPPPLPPLPTLHVPSKPTIQIETSTSAPLLEHCSCGLTFTVEPVEAIYELSPRAVHFESPIQSTTPQYGSQSVYSSTSSNVYEYEQSTTNDSSEDYASRMQTQVTHIHARCCQHARSNAHAQTEFVYEQR
ncbi:unnamed protein product [Ceratitis capitata]|uniref:(Mediterranean fruit fly) hypothetical protein n=2 Tax=Ceratitis capitata TaxID=7213 RepID=A0A811U5C4_CERCA|nr:unnamed protein product [Ceratitis capitata]